MVDLSVIILTYNEEKHIERAIKSVISFAKEVFVIDSFSTDRTCTIAQELGAKVFQHEFINQALQINWALENLPIKTEWIMRLDADEIVSPELAREIREKLPRMDNGVTGVYVKRRVHFMGRWIKHGGYYPTWLLRIWRRGCGFCEQRWMDEHIKVVKGKTLRFENDIIEMNLNNLSWWIDKHNRYASREAVDLLNIKYRFLQQDNINAHLLGTQEQRKRWFKEKVYANFPLFIRPFIYFLYRYFVKLGFLDGKEGLIFHFLQGFWYRFLVDAKIYEVQKKLKEGQPIEKVVKEVLGINL